MNGSRTLDDVRICGVAYCIECQEKCGLSEEIKRICINCHKRIPNTNSNTTKTKLDLDEDLIMKMKCKELKVELKSRKLKVTGSKQVLRDRLKNAVFKNIPIDGGVSQ